MSSVCGGPPEFCHARPEQLPVTALPSPAAWKEPRKRLCKTRRAQGEEKPSFCSVQKTSLKNPSLWAHSDPSEGTGTLASPQITANVVASQFCN